MSPDDKKDKLLFLYTELAAYITQCFEALAHSGFEVHVVAFPVNPEAPFRFDFESSGVHYYNRNETNDEDLAELIEELNPSLVFCSGWIDRGYISVCRKFRHRIRTVLISDNALKTGLRSSISALRARIQFKRIFDYAFVSGQPQVEYVRALGFSENEIVTGFYTADVQRFSSLSDSNTVDSASFPKRFVFAGRYVDFKGVLELWEIFSGMDTRGWMLECIGTGPLWQQRKMHKNIVHHGFVQPDEIDSFVERGGVFILPSWKEPWGVVVHEFAAAGYPLILSDQVNAGSAFLEPGLNGFYFSAGDKKSLKEAVQKIIALPDQKLRSMALKSSTLAQRINLDSWLDSVNELIKKKR